MFSSRSGLKPSLFTPISSSINSATLGFKKARVAGWSSTEENAAAHSLCLLSCEERQLQHAMHREWYRKHATVCLSPWWHLVTFACHRGDIWSAERAIRVASENVFHGMQHPRGGKVLRSKQIGKCCVQQVWALADAVLSTLHGTGHSHGSHFRTSHDPNTVGPGAAGQELLSKRLSPATQMYFLKYSASWLARFNRVKKGTVFLAELT